MKFTVFLLTIGCFFFGSISEVLSEDSYRPHEHTSWHSRLTAVDSVSGVEPTEAQKKNAKALIEKKKAIAREKYITGDPTSDGRNLQEGTDPDNDNEGDTNRDNDSDSNVDSE